MKLTPLLLVCLLTSFCYAQPNVSIELFGSNFNRPVNIKNAGDDRLFVVEQEGYIQILNADGSVPMQPFLNIEGRVFEIGGIGDERGLLGLAFHPNYAANGFFYVNYINTSGNTVISRFNVSAGDSNIADANSEVILLTINQPFSNHNGGDMNFGSDGFLYISSGDGGAANDPQDNGQDLSTLLGKLLRIDVDSGSPYAIPTDNPFANDGDPNTLPEIWAYGLRNPWKFSFDKDNGDVWIADVGQNEFEEINLATASEAGLNFGWRCYEGDSAFNTTGCPDANTLTFPVDDYSHVADGSFKCSVTGGYRYRGSTYPGISGWYFFADYCSGEIGYLEFDGTNWNRTFITPAGSNNWSSFGENTNGELYIAGLVSGDIYRIIDTSLSLNDVNTTAFKMYPNPSKDRLTISFEGHHNSKTVTIYDLQGKVLTTLSNIESRLFEISTKKFAKGLYIVKVLDQEGRSTQQKLMIR